MPRLRIAADIHGLHALLRAWHALARPACHPHSRAVPYHGVRIRGVLMLCAALPGQRRHGQRLPPAPFPFSDCLSTP